MRFSILVATALLIICFGAVLTSAQTTAFNYQGSLKNGGSNANGNYDFEFALFDALSGGTQLGSTQAKNNVAVADGTFSVSLDFGSQFPGGNRFLEIRVRLFGGGAFTPLTPRQSVSSAPYAVRSLNADSSTNATTATNALRLGGTDSSQYVLTGDARLSDSRTPTAGSANYIQNGTSQQAASNFSISGNGHVGQTISANFVNATYQYNIGDNRILSNYGINSLFAGVGAGASNANGSMNSFFGSNAGTNNTEGYSNSFFGAAAGKSNTTSNGNSFFGTNAGLSTTGGGNSFFGLNAGQTNGTGIRNTIIGSGADVLSDGLINATAIGFGARVDVSNSLVLGGITGIGFGTDTNIGIGTTTPQYRLDVRTASGIGIYGRSLASNPVGVAGWAVGPSNSFPVTFIGGAGVWGNTTSQVGVYGTSDSNYGVAAVSQTGGGLYARSYGGGNAAVLDGTVQVNRLGSDGSTSVCRNASLQLSTCSSSLRYKTKIASFGLGLALVKRFEPITFDWKEGGMHDLGLGAEDVAAIEPLLVTYNDKGEVEGVKYDRIGVVLVNAIKEQQAQIEKQARENEDLRSTTADQQAQIDTQQRQINELKQLLCLTNKQVEICKEQPK